ncbi:Hsp70 protein [Parafrankia irregularis]|uniref:Hsp70 protein n=1 Tax=Parafrankia irregularis TaxID=795642 RepID=A0A0S4QVL8_9ACTN|nr:MULTISPECIES: Hsp70 family protein [Parafrankia]MBE3202519.1 Hsp70 family protein [Parafrankia sp. CH37]CUU59555.1 Hsp70 protein [Parafrankia irregularis]
MAYALGIDVGTTFTAAAVWRDNRAETVGLGDHSPVIPSVLFRREDGLMLVGAAAEARAVTEPDRVARAFKRRLGDDVPIWLGDTKVDATDLTADMIRYVVSKVTERESQAPAHVTLACPATWSAHRRGLLEQAASRAGLGGRGDVGLLDEPTAAAVWYAAQPDRQLGPGELLAVYDFGGGTFDATVLRRTADGFDLCGAPGGEDSIGGADVDDAVLEHVARAVGPGWYELDVADPTTARAMAAVAAAAVTAKELLSDDTRAEIPVILPGVNRVVPITRDDLEDSVRVLILRTVDALHRTIAAAGFRETDLTQVLLVGGSSRIPMIGRLLADHLGVTVTADAHPKLAVCLGAAISAGARLAAASVPDQAAAPRRDRVTPGWHDGGWHDGSWHDGAELSRTAPPDELSRAAPPDELSRAAPPDDVPVKSTSTTTGGWSRTGPGSQVDPPGEQEARRAADLIAPVHGGPAPAEAAPAAVSLRVDLDRAGLTAATDQLLRPAASVPRRVPLADRDAPLVVRTAGDSDYRKAGRRGAVVYAAVAAVVLLVAVIVGIGIGLGGGTGDPNLAGGAPPFTRQGTTGAGTALPATEQIARLTGGPLAGAGPGPGSGTGVGTGGQAGGAARGIAPRPGGGWVAVGSEIGSGSTDETPAAWWTADGATWQRAATAGSGGGVTGGLGAVTATSDGTRLVAVGWDDSAAGVFTATAWTSTDGRSWQPASVERASNATLRDVVAVPGGLLAVGQDLALDREGDGTVWTSSDGTSWRRLTVTGVDGLGVQSLDRVARLADGSLLAVGREPSGAGSVSRVRRSTDGGAAWAAVETDLPDGAEVTGLAALPGGRLVGTGSTPAAGHREPRIWVTDAGARRWTPQEPVIAGGTGGTAGAARAEVDLLGVVAPGAVLATGTVAGSTPASWTIDLDQPR